MTFVFINQFYICSVLIYAYNYIKCYCKGNTFLNINNKNSKKKLKKIKKMELNERIKQLIDYYTDGVVARFSKAINLPAQTVNRLFNIDTRTNKFPTATTEVLQKIAERYEDVSLEWLLLGKGNMFKSKQPPENNEKDLIIELLKENNTLLKNEITRLKLQQNAH